MKLMLYNPAHPKNKAEARALSPEQFAVVHDYVVECMNKPRGKIDEAVILRMLNEAGLPLFP